TVDHSNVNEMSTPLLLSIVNEMSTPLLLSIGGGLRYPNPPYEGVGCVNEMSTPLTITMLMKCQHRSSLPCQE
ncbi:MAG: hypothetical protein P5678_25615, partial [Limnospira sp. PMC 1240.20]|nr:hypothetical protein [Limnospira sp. PMC 1256.20]MDT9221849.1 hypothetical protein [Limnospira sp. PMC 1240.20]MDT9282899.1 hypothetical protein [Limnospira sp. PMC 1293.21]